MEIFHESLGPAFEKWHLNSPHCPSVEFPDDCRPVIHRLDIDSGVPHDHPWSFTSFILCGGYEEEHFFRGPDGRWEVELIQCLPGTSRHVPFNHVHRVTRLLDGPCRTIVLYGPHQQDWRYFPEALDALNPAA